MTTRLRLLLVVLASTSAACVHRGARRESTLNELGPKLLTLTESVESEVHDGDAPDGLTDDELIQRATAHDPGLVAPFRGYAVRVAREDGHALLLVCTKDRKRALLEDAGCTYYLEKRAWKDSPPRRCEFSLRVPDVCGAGAESSAWGMPRGPAR